MPFNNKAPWTQTMQTKPDLRLLKNVLLSQWEIQWSFWKISKISVWSFKTNNTPLLLGKQPPPPGLRICPDVFRVGVCVSQLPSTEIVRKTIAGLCWHCLKMVWPNSYLMDTLRITTLRETIAPSCKWVSLWWWGIFVWGQTWPFFALRNELTGTMYGSSPLSATESPVPFLLFWFCGYSI